MSDLPFGEPLTPASVAPPAPRVCRRHAWQPYTRLDLEPGERCARCGRLRDVAISRRSRNNGRRGRRYELAVARALGGTKVGHHGGPEDVMTGLFSVQVKRFAAGRFPGWMADELARLPRTGGRVPLLIVGEATGGHGRGRALAIVDLEDWRALHGETT